MTFLIIASYWAAVMNLEKKAHRDSDAFSRVFVNESTKKS